jgi:ribosomal protein L14E/L6E/L27E
MELKKGQIVISKSGRDKGEMLAVVKSENGFVFVCNGKERPLERAKKKNLRHVQTTSLFIESDSMATNSKLRKTLRLLGNQGR